MQTFTAWLESRTDQPPLPETTRLTRLIATAGPNGVTARDLRRAVDLDRDLVDQLLAAMVAAGIVATATVDGETVYYALS